MSAIPAVPNRSLYNPFQDDGISQEASPCLSDKLSAFDVCQALLPALAAMPKDVLTPQALQHKHLLYAGITATATLFSTDNLES